MLKIEGKKRGSEGEKKRCFKERKDGEREEKRTQNEIPQELNYIYKEGFRELIIDSPL